MRSDRVLNIDAITKISWPRESRQGKRVLAMAQEPIAALAAR